MTWTYDGLISSLDRDWIRFYIGDTDKTDQQFTDEELAELVLEEGSKEAAALSAVDGLLAKYARLVTKAVGDLRISYSDRSKQLERLRTRIERKLSIRKAKPVAGGISKSRKDTVVADNDRVPPAFHRDQFTYPGAEIAAEDDDDDLTSC